MKKEISFFIVLVLFVSGCSEFITQEKCEEKVKSYFPENVTLYFVGGIWETKSGDWKIVEEDRHWNDGSVMGKVRIFFRKGSRPGENVNYIYSSHTEWVSSNVTPSGKIMDVRDGFFTYEKAVVDEDGTVFGHNVAFVSLVLKPILGTEGTIDLGYAKKLNTQDFEIVDSNFSRCNWIKD